MTENEELSGLNVRIKAVLEILDPPRGYRPWHGGPTLEGSLRGIDHQQAQWKPYPGRHNIWELTLHTGYWRYAIRRRLLPDSQKGFGRSPANWPEVVNFTERQWKDDQQLLREEHKKLVEAIKGFPPERLDETVPEKANWTYSQLMNGIAAHDTYHIGQIQLMKRLYTEAHSH